MIATDRHKQPRESFHLPEELQDALTAFCNDSDQDPGKSGVIRKALEKYLAEKGYWPPKGEA